MSGTDIWKKYKCVGIMGGTFNPIHNGHILIAKNAYEQYDEVEKIVFMPNSVPKYKQTGLIIQTYHRVNMTRRAIDKYEWASFSEIETERGGITYTYDTLLQIKKINPNLKIYFIIGADSLENIEKWHRYEDVLSMCTILVAKREGNSGDIYSMGEILKEKYSYCDIKYIYMDEYDASSTKIREEISEGHIPYELLPPEVSEYIVQNNLYS